MDCGRQELWDNNNICNGNMEEEIETEKILEVIITENSLKLLDDTKPQIQKVQKTSKWTLKKSTPKICT